MGKIKDMGTAGKWEVWGDGNKKEIKNIGTNRKYWEYKKMKGKDEY